MKTKRIAQKLKALNLLKQQKNLLFLYAWNVMILIQKNNFKQLFLVNFTFSILKLNLNKNRLSSKVCSSFRKLLVLEILNFRKSKWFPRCQTFYFSFQDKVCTFILSIHLNFYRLPNSIRNKQRINLYKLLKIQICKSYWKINKINCRNKMF